MGQPASARSLSLEQPHFNFISNSPEDLPDVAFVRKLWFNSSSSTLKLDPSTFVDNLVYVNTYVDITKTFYYCSYSLKQELGIKAFSLYPHASSGFLNSAFSLDQHAFDVTSELCLALRLGRGSVS